MNTVARIPDVKARTFKNIELGQLFAQIMAGAPVAPSKAALPLFVCGPLDGTKTPKKSVRHNAAIKAITCAIGDYDAEQMQPALARERMKASGLEALIYTSPSHKPERPRWRVVVPLARALPRKGRDLATLYRRIVGHVDRLLGGGVLTDESYTLSQSFYYGHVEGAPYEVFHEHGARLDGLKVPALELVRSERQQNTHTPAHSMAHWIAMIQDGTYHVATRDIVAHYISTGMRRDDAVAATQALMMLAPVKDDKWKARYDDIGRAADGAIEKGWAGPQPADVEKLAAALKQPSADDTVLPFKLLTGAKLMKQTFAPMKFWLSGALRFTVGAYLVTGKPKRGKSLMCIGVALTMAGCVPHYLDSRTDSPGAALYISCDDPSQERMQRRIKNIGDATDSFALMTDIDKSQISSIDLLDTVKRATPTLRLVVIDTLSAFRDSQRGESPYQQEYDELKALNDWAHANECVVLVVHHLRKGNVDPDDPFESISGTLGLQGAVDGMIVMERADYKSDFDESLDEKLAALWFKSRDIEEFSFGMRLSGGRWNIIGTTADVFYAGTNREILRVLNDTPGMWMTSKEIHAAGSFDCKAASVQQACVRLAKRGAIESQRGALPGKMGGGGGFRAIAR